MGHSLVNVGIVGCGLIGRKRAAVIRAPHRLVAVADLHHERAASLAAQHPGCVVAAAPLDVIANPDIQLVALAATNDALAALVGAAIDAGKHVIVEKPAARRSVELEPLVATAHARGLVVKVGFNHRFHPAFVKAREIWESGTCGPLMFIRGRYGQGGRLGMEREWRGTPAISGGGEMLDQGVHLIDLARWFAGEFTSVQGQVSRYFWNWEVEDNGFALLRTPGGQIAWLQASCTEWKNLFSFEIYARDAKLHIEGLGGSYGTERLSVYRMLPQMGPPETTIHEYPGADASWDAEFAHVLDCIATGTPVNGGLEDAVAALRIVETLYAMSPALGEPLGAVKS
ncbi:Inositol 2-dehydrogenase [Luteitalea pratensis]|uniref:Inositol 2-dehydrogenase n=1 Tax=Luteitalea pratensis TaxID=1855912 RepID=A0A143PV66_LUTPR|nr:Gfo/Idh/MocA family oxidoreductase [Luteitalea pratensis]AMY11724.1 Inositol 2-dehydrogenase [Luteitalea pratensis]